jgi:serine/threonine protein phosphatase PrpC
VVQDNKVYIANAGDSRVVVGKKSENFIWEPLQLSRDHKPELEEEKERILGRNGRVFQFKDHKGKPIGPYRVWHETLDYPGLAMSRSLGDDVAHHFGVSCDPEITEYEIKPEDKFIIIASDGIWDFLSNDHVIDILSNRIDGGDYKQAT